LSTEAGATPTLRAGLFQGIDTCRVGAADNVADRNCQDMDTSWTGNLEEVYGAMSRQTDRTKDYRLQAGEYVLGTLQDDERHNFDASVDERVQSVCRCR
jgi:hypothetical protein